MSRLEIDVGAGSFGTVRLDGKELDGVTSLNLDLSVGDMPKAQIEVILTDCIVRLEESETKVSPRIVLFEDDR